MIRVVLPNGAEIEAQPADTPLTVAGGIGARLQSAVLAAQVNGATVDAARPFGDLVQDGESVSLKLLTDRDPEALGVLRHSAAHVMARAVMRLFPDVKLAFGPTTASGFYYDFEMPRPLREEDFAAIEGEMKKIVDEAEPFERFSLNRQKALEFCGGINQDFKVEHIGGGLADHETLGFYRQGEFVDLCRGPHIPDAGRIKAFKLVSVAGSHWKGDQGGRPLQRLYGTAFFSKKDLDAYLEQIEEAKRRDHRVLGKRLGLFAIDPDVGQGLCLWLPKGAMIRGTLEEFLKKELIRRGYDPVYSPHLGRVELYETSGHFPYYRDSQFPPLFAHQAGQIVDSLITSLQAGSLAADDEATLLAAAKVLGVELENYQASAASEAKIASLRAWQSRHERYLIKPMNCPHHAMMYKSRPRSYRSCLLSSRSSAPSTGTSRAAS